MQAYGPQSQNVKPTIFVSVGRFHVFVQGTQTGDYYLHFRFPAPFLGVTEVRWWWKWEGRMR